MSTVADYQNRTCDFAVLRLTAPYGTSQQLQQALFDDKDSGQICTGIQKLAQRFFLLLMQKKGSFIGDPTRGTNFMIDADMGVWTTSEAVLHSFLIAETSVKKQLLAQELPNDPDDEKYGSGVMNGVSITVDSVVLYITITSLAGSSYSFITPITTALK